MFKTRNHLEKLEEKLRQKKLKKLWKLNDDNSNLYFACVTRFDSQDESRKEWSALHNLRRDKNNYFLG